MSWEVEVSSSIARPKYMHAFAEGVASSHSTHSQGCVLLGNERNGVYAGAESNHLHH